MATMLKFRYDSSRRPKKREDRRKVQSMGDFDRDHSGGGTLDRRASWQPAGSTSGAEASQDSSSGEATVTEASRGASPSSFSSSSRGASSESTTLTRSSAGRASSRRSPLPRYPSAESLTSFAESLVNPGGATSSSSSLVPAKSTPSLHQNAAHAHAFASRNSSVNAALHASRSTPNLDDAEDGSSMVTKKSSMYSYLHGTSSSSSKGGMGGSGVVGGRYWDVTMGADDTPDREDYAHHLRSSSYQLLHSRQLSALSSGSAGSYHSRQHSNTSNYSESDDLSPRADLGPGHTHHAHHHGMDRARFFSYDNLGPESASHKYHGSWNMSEPDLTLAPPPYSPPGPGFQHSSPISPIPPTSAPPPPQTSVRHSPTSNAPLSTGRHPSSPPPPPVRDASSLKYIKYGPGHEKYPSWPVPAAAANQVMPPGPPAHDANVSGLPDSSLSPAPQGSHRSKSWTEQSEYPKEKSGGYARPYNKKPFNPSFQRQLKTVMERTEKLPKEALHNNLREDMFSSSNYSFMDSYYKPSSAYYPLYDRDGRPLDDKDYSIPSPPERDLGPMGEATLGQVTAAQFEEYARRYEEFGYTDLMGTTPLLDQLRRESVTWDGSSERDSGRGESESVADSARYSNGRESVTTVVTNSSSASSSETLKWHGSLSDISIMSGHSRDPRGDHNIVHSSRVQAPQRHNSESVLYYGVDGRGKPPHGRLGHESRDHRDLRRSIRDTESGYPRPSREGKWSREVERNNEMNNLKKFPSYSYTQPLSQITEAPTAEMRETPRSPTRSPQSPTIDISKPPSVAERIHELERQSRSTAPEGTSSRWPRDQSGSRERGDSRDLRETKRPREDSTSQDTRETCDTVESRPSKEPRDPREHRDNRDLSREHREPSETRGHQRRGSRDSQRGDMRLEFSRTEQKCENGDTLRSPSTLGPSASRSPTQKDADGRPFGHENFQNLLNTFTEVDRSDRGDRVLERPERTSSNVSYSYLDPEKKLKVSDATLKSIQKQAVMSFYERHAGKSSGGASLSDLSSASSQSSLVSSPTASEGSQGKWSGPSHASMIQTVRTDRSGRAGKGLARLGRVPEGESDEHSLKPPRRRSMSGRDSGSEGGADDLSKAGSSQRSSLASETASSSRSEQPPALPQKQSQQVHQETVTRTSVTSSQSSISANEDARHSEEAEPTKDDDSSSRAPPSRGLLEGILPASDLAPFPPLQSEPPKPPSLPPPAHDEPPPRPPERPPKKPTLRSLFHGPNADAANAHNGPSAAHGSAAPSAHPNAHAEKGSNESELRRIEESANELRNLSPARPYYYRKPPAPDPPKSPEATSAAPVAPASAAPAAAPTPGSPRPPRSPRTARLHTSPAHAAHLVAPTSPTSRSSTPDLPPPPPPPVTDGEVVLNDDPLPPPPSEVASPPTEAPPVPPDSPPRERLTGTPPPVPRDASKNIITPQTYHKDSYMAHRRDWKTGFEGRYRRTISPSAANRNLLYSRDDNTNNNHNNNKNNNDNTNNNINSPPSSTSTTPGSAATRTSPTPPQEQERRSSTTPPSGVLRPVGSSSSLVQNNNSKNVIDNDNNVNNNGWAGHARSTSTTVSFTAEELRAFKARRAHAHTQEASAHSSDNKENAPRPLHPSQSSPSLSSSTALRSLASEGSTTSLASGGAGSSFTSGRSGSPASPAKLSPAHSWRTSLDSLHRPPLSSPSPPATATASSDAPSSSPRPITRATSLADPLNKEEAAAAAMSGSVSQEALHLPSTSSVSESLNRIAAISDSLSRSTSVTESLCRSTSLTETPTSTHSRASSVSEVPTYLSSPPAAPASSTPAAPSSPTSPVPHDGPVTAHPATVTEEPSPRPLLSTPKAPSSPKSPLSTKSLSSKSSLSPTPLSPTSPLSPTTSKAPTFPSSSASTTAFSTTTTTVSSTSSSSSTSSTVTNSTPSFPVTSPSMSPTSSSADKSNIVVLGYGRTRYQEEIDCDQLSKDYAPHLLLDTKLRALLAPGPEHKTAAYYMQGVFTLELRKDLINSTHAHHPDLSNLHTPKTMAPNNTHSHTTPASPPATNGDATTCLNTTSDKSPLPADSAYFTTSESKAKLLTRLRGSGNNLQDTITPVTDHQQLLKRKEELVASIGRKLEILRAEREAIKEEMRLNQELGAEVTQEVEARASLAEAEKYKLHVEEIDKITSLLLGLSGRLARAENALLMLVKEADPEEKRILEGKRDKLRDQLEEAKRLKENTDRRAIQVAKVLNQYLSEDEYADYDHFIKMKAKLIMDAREIDDKIKLGEEQQQALVETMCCKNP